MIKLNYIKYSSILHLYLIPLFFLGFTNIYGQDNSIQKPELVFSFNGGFYSDDILVELSSPGAKIYYTLDGNNPNSKTKEYHKPIKIDETTVLRAIAYKDNEKSKIVGHTYFINEPFTTFPTVSVAIPPAVLFDPERGLYVKGPNAIDSLWTKDGANFWSKREVTINTEIFEADGQLEFNSETGFRLFGGMSRLFPQKSMTIVSRDRYGDKRVKHKVFGKAGKNKYKFLVLRNSGSDWGKTHFRDGLMTGLLDDWNIEKQDFRPSHVYINGKYWGIYNIREKVNRYFLSSHCDVHKDSLDLIEHKLSLKRGNKKHYLKMLTFLEDKSMADPENYAYLQSMMDVENFMDYQIAQIYFDNQDAGGNIKFWRPQTPNGKWRWIMYDTDWGFGLHNSKAYKNNSLAFHTKANGPSWPNPPWSTFILRKLLKNTEFKQQFITRFQDHLNESFNSKTVLEKIAKFEGKFDPEISRHLKRWKLSKRKRESQIDILRNFAKKRPTYMRKFIQKMFDVGESVAVSIQSSEGGRVILNNNIKIKNKVFNGVYFEKLPITITATPKFGYRFSHWEGIQMDEVQPELNLNLKANRPLRLKAVFEAYVHPLAGKIMLNEISCNNKLTGDWVELYNNSEEAINLKNWIFTGNKKTFKFFEYILNPDSYVILCEDSISFKKFYSGDIPLIGNFTFGLSKRKERLGLFTNLGASIDSITYELEPKDTAFTLTLSLPHLDNSDLENWEVVKGFGSPMKANPFYLMSQIKEEQEMWIRVGVGIGLLLSSIFVVSLVRRRKEMQEELLKAQAQIRAQIPPVNQVPPIKKTNQQDEDYLET